ncbi:hypothetical protein [Microvirgula aerodenitrificans]|uniref:hypothetical protein n=1 Tax=Microvirgula aerodenitrificans TaxID=57480 RepID=UPI00248E35A1|nr:hypothetical protein [Microvirgula aerodenitrificans]
MNTNEISQAKYIQLNAGVRYWEDAKLNGEEDTDGQIPLRDGEDWSPTIELATGRVLDWPAGVEADIHYKVCDAGAYWLLNAGKVRFAHQYGYVPDYLAIGQPGYGDYIIMKIGAGGMIAGWRRPDLDPEDWEILLAPVAPAMSDAARDVLAERQRQISAEGWTPEHDDCHVKREMACAAACYALPEITAIDGINVWPWEDNWWKPRDHRSNLIRAGALILAEIERLDRAASQDGSTSE